MPPQYNAAFSGCRIMIIPNKAYTPYVYLATFVSATGAYHTL